MISNLPQQLSEAVEFLKKFESSKEHVHKVQCFKAAINIIKNHLSENPNSLHGETLLGLKRTYTGRLLSDLSEDSGLPIPQKAWWDYFLLIATDCKEDVEILTQENPKLKESYENFIEMWRDDIMRVIEYWRRRLEQKK